MKKEFNKGWKLKKGDILNENPTEDDLWSGLYFFMSHESKKRNSYKFSILKSILDNLFNSLIVNGYYQIGFNDIFTKFTENYWNLVLKHDLKQIRKDGKSTESKIEQILRKAKAENGILENLEFESVSDETKTKIIKEVSDECKKYVFGALYSDFNGLLYGFDKSKNCIWFSCNSYKFLLKHKTSIEKLNYFCWAEYLESVNKESDVLNVIHKLDLSTKRKSLSVYRTILYKDFKETNCFYCGKGLGKNCHVDHFVPWSFTKDDKIWNFVLSCSSCNIKKKDKIANTELIRKINLRNNEFLNIQNSFITKQMTNYRNSIIEEMCKYALLNGYREWE